MLYDSTQDKYVGFVNYGPIQTEKPDTLATEAVVFLLVGARTHWKYPIGYFLADKLSSKTQAKLVQLALKKAAEADLLVWSVTADGTSVNISIYFLAITTWYRVYSMCFLVSRNAILGFRKNMSQCLEGFQGNLDITIIKVLLIGSAIP